MKKRYKTIKGVAPLLANIFTDYDADKQTLQRYLELVEENSHQLGLLYKYFYRLHDSRLIKAKLTRNKFVMILDHFTTHIFAEMLVKIKNLKIDHDLLVFPIRFEFEILNLSFNKVRKNGKIIKIKPTNFHEYLYEQIISINGNLLEIGLVVWKTRKRKQSKYILILIKAKNINVVELQQQAWKNIFRNNFNDYFGYFKSQFDRGRYLNDDSNCRELIEEFEQKRQVEFAENQHTTMWQM